MYCCADMKGPSSTDVVHHASLRKVGGRCNLAKTSYCVRSPCTHGMMHAITPVDDLLLTILIISGCMRPHVAYMRSAHNNESKSSSISSCSALNIIILNVALHVWFSPTRCNARCTRPSYYFNFGLVFDIKFLQNPIFC